MILDRFKELNVTDEDLEEGENIFDKVYIEYINNNINNKKIHTNTYIHKNPIDRMKAFVENKILKNLKKNDYTHNTIGYNKNGTSQEIISKKETNYNNEHYQKNKDSGNNVSINYIRQSFNNNERSRKNCK